MKLPLHTTSAPIVGTEAQRLFKAVKAGRAVSNPRAKQFAAEIVAELRQTRHFRPAAAHGVTVLPPREFLRILSTQP